MNILDELKARGILNNITNEEKFNKLKEGDSVYIGFDPTAKSLHFGNFIQISVLNLFKRHGFKPVALIGGATGMIGDPSGKSEERSFLNKKELEENKNSMQKQLEAFDLKIVDNYDFYKDMNVLDFLRDAGKLLNVSYMINKDIVKSRIETGISFTEFSYQLIQGWDFKTMNEEHGVSIQVGGSDQWGNITAGIEMIRKSNDTEKNVVGITTNLLTNSAGKKFGKSEEGAIFLDKNLTSPLSLYQYLINLSDDDAAKLSLWLLTRDVQAIQELIKSHKSNPSERKLQKTLAEEMVTTIHDEDTLKNCKALTDSLFGKGSLKDLSVEDFKLLENFLPTTTPSESALIEVIVEIKLASSKREAREFLEAGAIEVNGSIEKDESLKLDKASSNNGFTIIKKGKKKHFLLKFN